MAGDLRSPQSGRVLGEESGPDKASGATNSPGGGKSAQPSAQEKAQEKVGPPDALKTGGPVPLH
jgi:hypothetical protein